MQENYKTPESNLVDENEQLEYNYGGFWIRFIASCIDSIWVVALIFFLGWMVYGAVYFESTELLQGKADFFISYVLPFMITISFWIYKSATPGKMLLGLKIIDAKTLEKPSTGKLLLRYLGYYVSLILLGLGYLWVAWDKRKQGWHDKIAGTVVVRNK